MKSLSKQNNYDFAPSKLSDDKIKQISNQKNSLINIWENGKGSYGTYHDKEVRFNEVIKQIYVCLPDYDTPGNWNDINFLVEFKDDLTSEINKNKFTIETSLKTQLKKLFSEVDVNVYFKENVIDKTKPSSMLPESIIQHNKFIAYAGIPIAAFSCQTLEEFHDQTQTNFDKWQNPPKSLSSKDKPKVDLESKKEDDSIGNPKEILTKIKDISPEDISALPTEIQREFLKSASLLLRMFENSKSLQSNNLAQSPKPKISDPTAQSLASNSKQLTVS